MTIDDIRDYFNHNLSENFKRKEFQCHGKDCCGNSAPVSPMLIDLLQEIRSHFGKAIYVNRGFSCIVHNFDIGSNITSDHCLGLSADCDIPPGLTCEMIRDVAITMPGLAKFGMYDTHFHVSIERTPKDELIEWDERTPTKKT